jgi:hypothetical protein
MVIAGNEPLPVGERKDLGVQPEVVNESSLVMGRVDAETLMVRAMTCTRSARIQEIAALSQVAPNA